MGFCLRYGSALKPSVSICNRSTGSFAGVPSAYGCPFAAAVVIHVTISEAVAIRPLALTS